MHIPLNKRFITPILILIAISFISGCRTTASKKEDVQQERFKTKIKQYQALSQDLNENKIKKGLLASEVRAAYGDPDDIFSSGGSTSGSLEIWSYGKILNKDQIDFWHPIRLYFSNNKLIDWNY